MGAACCVAAKDKTISSGSHAGPLQRHSRYSPTWSFRWDNRVREAEEETPSGGNSLSNPSYSGNERMRSKSSDNTTKAAFGSERDSPLSDSSQKPTASESTAGIQRIPSCGEASLQNIADVKESTGSSSVSCSSPLKLSPAVSSLSASSLSSQSQLILPPNSDPRFHHHRSPAHGLVLRASDNNNNNNQTPENKSPRTTYSISEETSLYIPPLSGNESTRSFDTGSIPGFSDLTNARRGERWSFDSEASGFSRDKISTRSSGSLSFDLHSCGICSKHLNERTPWGLNKLISTNGLSVVSVLTCGHVYHAECLEYMTPEINKYDPSCPVCAFGEKKMAKMSEMALKAKLESKARKKKSRNCVIDSDLSDVSSDYNMNSGVLEGKDSKMGSSSVAKPFLRRHFSFGSKSSSSTNKPSSENRQSSAKKGFFWARSSKY